MADPGRMQPTLSTTIDVTRFSPSVARFLFRGPAPEGVAEARLLIDEFGAQLVVTYEARRPPTIVTFRGRGAILCAALLLRDHPDELADVASELFAFGVKRWLARLEEPGRRYDLALGVLAREAEGDELARDERHAATLERALEKHLRGLAERVAAVPREAHKLDGSAPLWLDEALADYLDGLGTTEAAKASKAVRRKAGERVKAYTAGGSALDWLEPWLSDLPDGEAGVMFVGALPAVRNLARFVWLDEVRPALSAPPHRVEAVSVAGDHYAKMPKVVAPVSWGFGAPGIAAVEVDGNAYAEAPTLAKLIPRTWALLPADYAKRPHQTMLALELDEAAALPVMVADAQGYVLSPQAAKLALVMLASEGVRRGGLHAADVGTLTRWTRPEAPRIRARDYETTAKALEELNRLWLYLPDETRVKLFDLQLPRTPDAARADMVLRWGLSGTLRAALEEGIRGPMLDGREYNGEFLINLTGAMRLPNTEPALLRYYMRAAADWNNACSAGSFDAERVKAHTRERWAVLANALPRGAAEYLAAKKGHRAATSSRRAELSKARAAAAEHLERLAEEYGLAKLEKVGRDGFRLLPTSEHLEARDKARAKGGGVRPVEPPTFSTRKPMKKRAK